MRVNRPQGRVPRWEEGYCHRHRLQRMLENGNVRTIVAAITTMIVISCNHCLRHKCRQWIEGTMTMMGMGGIATVTESIAIATATEILTGIAVVGITTTDGRWIVGSSLRWMLTAGTPHQLTRVIRMILATHRHLNLPHTIRIEATIVRRIDSF
jgi:hypothetical protein